MVPDVRRSSLHHRPGILALIAAGRGGGLTKPFTKLDLVAAASLVVMLGANGRRGAAIAVILVLAFAYASRPTARSRTIPILVGTGLLVGFAYQVVVYRTTATGADVGLAPIEVLLRDLASVPFTSGVTDRLLVHFDQYNGATLLADLVHLLPGPLTAELFGPTSDTGALVFRYLYGAPDTLGYGYSIPAEGILNFGTAGAFLLPFAMGATLAWLYARADFNASRAVQLAYYLAAATLPFAWRSDVLGAVKGVLYPLIVIWLVLLYARTIQTLIASKRLRPGSMVR